VDLPNRCRRCQRTQRFRDLRIALRELEEKEKAEFKACPSVEKVACVLAWMADKDAVLAHPKHRIRA